MLSLGLTQLPANNAGLPSAALPPLYVNAEADRRDVDARLEAMHMRLRRERRAQFYRDITNLWPVALGLGLSCCAAPIRDAVAGVAPLLAKFLFPLSALAAFHDMHLGPDALPALSLVLLYGQFFVDGLLVCMLLRQRSHPLNVCLQLVLFHALFLVSIGLVEGSFSAIAMN